MNGPPRRLGGRYEIEKELVAEEDLRRWRGKDATTGRLVEIVAPRAHALLRDGARAAFSEVEFSHVAVLAVLARFEEDGVPYLVRPVTQGTLAGVRLTPGEAQALLGWLVPAVLAADGRFGGELRGEDVVLDEAGVPRLACIRLPRTESVARVHHHRAPEVLDGAEPTAESDLFGLGVLAYRAVAGVDPWPAASTAQLRRRESPAPRLSDHVAVPEELDAALAGLVSLDPADRRAAALAITPAAAPVLTAPPLHDAPVVQRAQRARAAAPVRPPFGIVTPLQGMTEADLRRVAVRSGVDVTAVQRVATRGGDWLLDTADNPLDAERLARRYASRGLPARMQTTEAPRVIQWLLLAGIAAAAGFVVDWPRSLAFWAASALLLVWTGRNVAGIVPVARARTAVADRLQAAAAAGPEVRALALARRTRDAEHLPAPVRADLREAAERALDHLADLAAAEGELAGDDHGARGRLHADRERIAHELAHLDLEFARAAAEANLDPSSPKVLELGKLARETAP